MTMNIAVIIPAAGMGERYAAAGGMRSKIDEDLGSRSVLQRTIELFNNEHLVQSIIVAGPADPEAMEQFKQLHGPKLGFFGVKLCTGGTDHRWQTVQNALEQVPEDATHIAVHDAARPCASPELIQHVFDAAARFDAVVPGLDVSDTLKRISSEPVADEIDPLDLILGATSKSSTTRLIEETVDRSNLVSIQTPQIFKADLLRRAYQQDDLTSTDDAALIEKLNEPVHVVPGQITNIKITRPEDLALVRAIMGVGPARSKPAHKRF